MEDSISSVFYYSDLHIPKFICINQINLHVLFKLEILFSAEKLFRSQITSNSCLANFFSKHFYVPIKYINLCQK